jgi:probable HAF family extracellular repeat protein
MTRRTKVSIALSLFVELGLLAAQAVAQVSFTPLGFLPGAGRSEALAVSDDGSTVVGWAGSASSIQIQAFRWTAATGMSELGPLPSGFSGGIALGVSSDGAVIVGGMINDFLQGQAFRWTADTGFVGLGYLAGDRNSGALATSADGSVVVGQSGDDPTRAFRWTAADGMVQVGPQPGVFSRATDVSADGTVIVGNIQDRLSPDPFRWTAADGFVQLGPFIADGVSADGLVVVGAAGSEAVRWTEAIGRVFLGDLPGGTIASGGLDVSADGTIVVGSGATEQGSEAMFWTQPTGMVNVREFLLSQGISEVSDWKLVTAEGVSADGLTIVGRGENPAGQREGWIATIPEPSTIALAALAAACALLAVRRCERHRHQPTRR